MIGPDARDIADSFRRGPRRGDLLLELDAHGIASANHLAAAIGVTALRIVWMMHGKLPFYRRDTALVTLGLVRPVAVRRGRAYEITDLGRRVSRILGAERRRGEIERHVRRERSKRLRGRG